MNRNFIARSLLPCMAVCYCALSARAQQPIPLDVPETAALQAQVVRHPELVTAELRVRAAEARVRSARTLRAPASLFFEAEELALDHIGSANIVAGLEHEFTRRPQRAGQVAVAAAEAATAAAALEGVRLRLASRLTRAFLEAVVYERIARRLAQEDTLLERAEAALNARFAVGQARYVDVIRLRTERLRVQADVIDAQTEVSRAQLQLRALAGRAVSATQMTAVTLRLPGVPSNVDSLIAASPALKIAAADQERAGAALRLAVAERTRRVTGNVGVQRFTHEAGSAIGPAIGFSFTLPSTNRATVQAAVAAAQIDTAAGAAHTRATAALLRAEITAALRQIDVTARRIAGVDQQLINAAREEREAALTAYTTGELTLVELLDFERSLSRAEVQLLQSYDAAIEAWDRANHLLAGAGTRDGENQ